jgi:hypothetical protein
MIWLLAWFCVSVMVAVSIKYLAAADRLTYELILIVFALPLLATIWSVAYVGHVSYKAAISGFKEANE